MLIELLIESSIEETSFPPFLYRVAPFLIHAARMFAS
jgi:hypothetical protein